MPKLIGRLGDTTPENAKGTSLGAFGREVRKVLFDREDLDRLVAQSKGHL